MMDINRPKSPTWTSTHPKTSARTWAWGVVLGIVGFICGYAGQPLLLKSGDSLGPLLGFLTGPVGVVVGLLLGERSTKYRLDTGQNLLALALAAVAVGGGTLYLTVAEFDPIARLVDAEIVGCERIDKLLASQTEMWSEVAVRAIRNGDADARPNWKPEIADMLQGPAGAVLTVRIYQAAWVSQQEWRWGSISRRVGRWKNVDETERVFAAVSDPVPPSPCERFVIGERKYSALVDERTNVTPPSKLSAFLWLDALQQVPPEYVRYIPKPR